VLLVRFDNLPTDDSLIGYHPQPFVLSFCPIVTARNFKSAATLSKEITTLATSKAESQKKLEELKVSASACKDQLRDRTEDKAAILVLPSVSHIILFRCRHSNWCHNCDDVVA
jgi:hypothetical protein